MMRYFIIVLILFSSHAYSSNSSLTTIGWIEPVMIAPEAFELFAKIDTGADNSSIGIETSEEFIRNGQQWIRFQVRNNSNQVVIFERPVIRYASIKAKKTGTLERPVVNMQVCLGKQQYEVPVNLAQRKSFKYRMLIGRSFLKSRFLVDSASKNTTRPSCAP